MSLVLTSVALFCQMEMVVYRSWFLGLLVGRLVVGWFSAAAVIGPDCLRPDCGVEYLELRRVR